MKYHFHKWVCGGLEAADYAVFCRECGKESTISAYGYAPLFFDGGIRQYKNPKWATKKDFKRLDKSIFDNLANECK